MQSIETLTPGGPVHWGVMLAQGWKGELASVGRAEAWAAARDWAQEAERLGFDGVWVFDHFQPYPARDDSPVLEAWTTLAALSQVTERVVIGTLVSCAGYRNPQVTVKMAENMAVLSEGRFCLGLGAGWDGPEFESLGISFPTAAKRSDQLEAGLRACRTAWSAPGPSASGTGTAASPGRGPLLLAGGEGEKRTLPAAVAYADVTNWQVGVAEFTRKSRVLAELCEAAGRDPDSVRRTHSPNFQLFESEHEFALWRQSQDRGMSSEEVYAYIRSRGALYGIAAAVEETIEEFQAAGCRGFMVFCNDGPSTAGLKELASSSALKRTAQGEDRAVLGVADS
jgi:alkanesulfonate monooxygenase SsuD/methylene tetrahydromethanopterin reductase-like flavin-dependent oxidoreductase (luciferase family)